MRNIIGFVVGLYLTVALVVFACGVWTFTSDARWKHRTCTIPGDLKINAAAQQLDGPPDWLPWAAYRAIAWPKAYADDQRKVSRLEDWLFVHYNPFQHDCR
ncbi:MAG: hypothetical protein EON93_13770 [Burkholderiales bacterium]|nr:MAG: hypothetical protein EON93_13770 [Burkholderiales bacterium]